MELLKLLKTSSLKKLIASKKLIKLREEKMANPSQGKEDPYMRRNKIKFAKFYTLKGVVIFVDRFKKLLSSENTWQKSMVDYESIQKVLDSKTLDKLLTDRFLITEEDWDKSMQSEVQKLCDPYLTTSFTTFITKDGTKIRIDKHKQIIKGTFRRKGVDYGAIQKVLDENNIINLILDEYLIEVGETNPKNSKPESVLIEEIYKYEGNTFVIQDRKHIVQFKEDKTEASRLELQHLIDTKTLDYLIYNGVVRKVNKKGTKKAVTEIYKTTDKLEHSLEFMINAETQYLHGKTSEAAMELFQNSSLEKLIDEGKVEKVSTCIEKKTSEGEKEVTKRKQLKTQCWINPEGDRVFINVETLQPHGRVTKNIKELIATGQSLRDLIRCGYLQRLITPGELEETNGEDSKIENARKRKTTIIEKASTKRAKQDETSPRTSPRKLHLHQENLVTYLTCHCPSVKGSAGKGRKRKQNCGKCLGCTKPECETCHHCKDMIKFGGTGTMKQRCIYKICHKPKLPNCPCFAKE